jgi:flagellar assembly protein FliH
MPSRVLRDAGPEVHPVTWQLRTVPAATAKLETQPAGISEAQVQHQVRQALETGRREGEAAARQQFDAEVRDAVAQFAQAAVDVARSRAASIRRAESDIVQLAIEIARRILHRELSVDRSAVSALIRAALEKLVSQEVHRVRVHPEHEALVRECLKEAGRDGGVEVIGDPTQPRGGAVFESARGSLDASVETQFREIERGLADQLQERT